MRKLCLQTAIDHSLPEPHAIAGNDPGLFQPRQTNEEVMALFVDHPELHAVAVVKDGQPIGLINRRLVNERMAQPFARELLARKSCTALMNGAPLVCDENRSLESLADVLRGEDQRYLADGFIVTRKGHYLGLGTGEALVRRVSELRIEAARHANPLTFLPGNIPTTEHLERLIDGGGRGGDADFDAGVFYLERGQPRNQPAHRH